MAEHVRNLLAREGFLLRPDLVTTLSKFVEPFAANTKPVPLASLAHFTEEALELLQPSVFHGVYSRPGFRDTVAALIGEFSAAGADSTALRALLGEGALQGPFGPAVIALFEAVEQRVSAVGQALRHTRLRQAAATIDASGVEGVEEILLDGFLSFPAPELEVLASLSRHVDLTVALPQWPGSERACQSLVAAGLEEVRLPARQLEVQKTVAPAPTLEQEVEEICRRLLAAGRPFREIGIVVRNTGRYVPALKTALSRFGIPSRFYITEPLDTHSIIRYFSIIVNAAIGGWDHELLIPALAMEVSGLGGTASGDRLEFKLREGLPNLGLDSIRALDPHNPALDKLLASLAGFELGTAGFVTAGEWVIRLSNLRRLLHIAKPATGVPHEFAMMMRAQAATLAAFEGALGETADILGADSLMDITTFWKAARSVLSLTSLRVPDHRSNVVHVLDAWEARQWSLPLLFVCGLVEGEFPKYPPEEPLIPDDDRQRMAGRGVAVRTTRDRQDEEDFLWQMTSTRATAELVLTYPRFTDAGESTLPSFHLRELGAATELAVAVRPASARTRAMPAPAVIREEELWPSIARLYPKWRPTAIESFLQCPFQFFARHTLRLADSPAKPDDRMDALAQGNVVHSALAAWHGRGGDLLELLDGIFQEYCREKRVREGYRSEMARLAMVRNLEEFLLKVKLEPDWAVNVEQPFLVTLEDNVVVSGRIDRYDVAPDGRARLYDYKYSSPTGVAKRFQKPEADRYVQGGLYLRALRDRYRVESFHYWGLKGGATQRGWSDPREIRELMAEAERLTVDATRRVAQGEIAIRPFVTNVCGYCDYRDACRVKSLPAAETAAAGDGKA
ncbi:MAG: PD-(D/E)XK nuclease family protein [Bryobacteraceae bacterium]